MPTASRPVFLNLLQIKMPVGALTSIGHRISGVILAAGVPAGLYLLALSLRSEDGFAHAVALAGSLPVKVAGVLLAWALAHHLLAGVRHMFSDINVGSPLRVARKTAYLVNFGALVLAAVAAGLLW
jgi:succinate dehydrogenase / fumarate reductase, cytochrome b subunit